jgi:hypothetical protein
MAGRSCLASDLFSLLPSRHQQRRDPRAMALPSVQCLKICFSETRGGGGKRNLDTPLNNFKYSSNEKTSVLFDFQNVTLEHSAYAGASSRSTTQGIVSHAWSKFITTFTRVCLWIRLSQINEYPLNPNFFTSHISINFLQQRLPKGIHLLSSPNQNIESALNLSHACCVTCHRLTFGEE